MRYLAYLILYGSAVHLASDGGVASHVIGTVFPFINYFIYNFAIGYYIVLFLLLRLSNDNFILCCRNTTN